MEVVLTPLRRASKTMAQTTKPSSSKILAESASTATAATHSGPPSEPASASEVKPAMRTPTTRKAPTNQILDDVVIVGTGVRPNSKRKRAGESGEGLKAEDGALEPRTQDQTGSTPAEHTQVADRTYPCCPPMPLGLGQNQPPACCSMPFGHFPPPPQPPHAHSCSHVSCSYPHQVHHCSSVHQHQHQHLHTHLPYPLPQHAHSFTANELTEAAFKFMYGISAMHPSGSTGLDGMWAPPGAHIPYAFSAMGMAQGQAQAGSSVQVSPPKLEQVPSSQEDIPDSQERIPSSQENERRREEKEKLQLGRAKTGEDAPPLRSNSKPRSPLVVPQELTVAPSRPNAPLNSRMDDVSSTPPPEDFPPSSGPRVPTPKRESSVIDIESDSEDELAEYNAGEGSMRWEPPIKDEDSDDGGGLDWVDSDDDVLLLGKPANEGGGQSRRRMRRVRPRKSTEQKSFKSRTSPSKPRRIL
jgi:hypothetical protein